MFQEAINNYLQSHGYNTINLKAVLFGRRIIQLHAQPCRIMAQSDAPLRFRTQPR